MNLRFLSCLVAFATVAGKTVGAVSIGPALCMSSEQCGISTSKDYCCPNGNTGTRNVCHSGWTKGSDGICTRASEDAGEDDKGYMEIQYGTCSPSISETYGCYTGSDSSSVVIDGVSAPCQPATGFSSGFTPIL